MARGDPEPDRIGLLRTVLGPGGLAGAFVNRPVSRCGPATTSLLCPTTLLVTSVAALDPTLEGRWWPLIGAAIFRGAYMAMSGVLILWSLFT